MNDSDLQDEKVTFRQDSVDNVFSQGRKPFFVRSPSNLSKYTITFVWFLLFIFTSLYFIKLPVHINAVGEILAGKDYYQIVINEDNQLVNSIDILEGERVAMGQELLKLESRDKAYTLTVLLDLNLQIQELNAQLIKLETHHREGLQNISQQRSDQNNVVAQLESELISQKEILSRYEENVLNGLIAATLEDTQKRIVSQTEGYLIKEKKVFTELDLYQIELEAQYIREKDTSSAKISRLNLQKDHISNGRQVFSPCDCVVDNLFIENGISIVPGQSILTLSQARDTSSLLLYVPASQYRKIGKGSSIRVNVKSYPSNKYGALKATIVSVSASPVPGGMIGKKGQGLQDVTYFIVKATIDNVPKNVTLVTGMAVDSDIVVDETSLFDLMFDLNNKS